MEYSAVMSPNWIGRGGDTEVRRRKERGRRHGGEVKEGKREEIKEDNRGKKKEREREGRERGEEKR